MKKLRGLLMLAFMVGVTGQLWAINPDGLTITIKPTVGYAVDIDTGSCSLTFNSAALNLPDYVVMPATVTIESTWATTDLQLDAALTGGWSISSATDTANALQVWVLFSSTTVDTIPAKSGDAFDDTNDRVASGTQQVGDASAKYESAGVFDTDSQSINQESHMWIRFHKPKSSDYSADQLLSLTLTAQGTD